MLSTHRGGTSAARFSAMVALAVMLPVGCWRKPDPAPVTPPAEAGPVRLLVADDPQLAESIRLAWAAEPNEPLEVATISAAELVAQPKIDADAVIYPAALLGVLAERELLRPLEEESLRPPPYDSHDTLPLPRLRETAWGSRGYAVTFGSPQLMLFYRRDLLDALGEPPPRDWTAYGRLVEKLAAAEGLPAEVRPTEGPWAPVCEPVGPGWGGLMLLARAAPYVRSRSRYSALFHYVTMAPLIAEPPYVRALEEMVAAQHAAPDELRCATPHDARRALLAGRCALAVAWPTRADESVEKLPGPIGVALLPGAEERYDFTGRVWEPRPDDEEPYVPLLGAAGRLGSVVRGSPRTDAARRCLATLAGREWSVRVAPRSEAVTLSRSSHLASPLAWVDPALEPLAAEYADAAQRSQSSAVWLFAPRIPGRERYLAALDAAVAKALAGEAPPADVLAEAADAWRAITDELGVDAQRRAYERCLGLEP